MSEIKQSVVVKIDEGNHQVVPVHDSIIGG